MAKATRLLGCHGEVTGARAAGYSSSGLWDSMHARKRSQRSHQSVRRPSHHAGGLHPTTMPSLLDNAMMPLLFDMNSQSSQPPAC